MNARIPGPAEVLAETERALRSHSRLVLCHIVRAEGSTSGKPGWRLLVRPDGSTFGNLGGGAFEALVVADARQRLAGAGAAVAADTGDRTDVAEPEPPAPLGSEVKRYYLTEKAVRGEATGMACGGFVEVFLEGIESPPVLAVCGGGPVGQALAQVAGTAGFDVVVADDREEFRHPELFPEGTAIVAVDREFRPTKPANPTDSTDPTDSTVLTDLETPEPTADWLAPWRGRRLSVAVVSRCWETDTAALASVVRPVLEGTGPALAYLGLMGSRRKIERVRTELAHRGIGPETLERLPFHAPIGLPLGGDTPGEIAVSITAEMVSVRHGAATGAGTAPTRFERVG